MSATHRYPTTGTTLADEEIRNHPLPDGWSVQATILRRFPSRNQYALIVSHRGKAQWQMSKVYDVKSAMYVIERRIKAEAA